MGEVADLQKEEQISVTAPAAIVEAADKFALDKIQNPSTFREFYINNLIDEHEAITEASKTELKNHVTAQILHEKANHPILSTVSNNQEVIGKLYTKFKNEGTLEESFKRAGSAVALKDSDLELVKKEGTLKDYQEIMGRAFSKAALSYQEFETNKEAGIETNQQEPVSATKAGQQKIDTASISK